ncbi:universal stress protein [Olivibacter domesticus]|uniref:Universal stress protein family protein n=1 Tax=Olivibacter domesticus TaxID=407022 RepID=A0A1H7G8K3_OLID1|nr:universal stress protein [Olivibacter domesticus]SEK34461.1 Universal stress protein family protein [Olivibacter domesticus]
MISKTKNTILVALDMSEMDHMLISYLKVITELFNVEKIIFLHNVRLRELPSEMRGIEMLGRIKERVRKKIENQFKTSQLLFNNYEISVETEEFSENAFDRLTKQRKVDLVVLGNKQHLEGDGGLAQKLIRLLPCDMLLVPETIRSTSKKYLCTLDFSKYSKSVYNVGRFLAEKSPDNYLLSIHVAKTPVHFFLGLSEIEIRKLLKEETESKKMKWIKQYQISSEIEIIQADGKHIASTILQYAELNKVTIVIMGVKGISTITNLFIGGVTNEIFHHETNSAILILKNYQEEPK